MIRIFGIRNSAVCSDFDPEILYILEAEFLQKIEQVDQKPEICRQSKGVGSSIGMPAK
jgi:hypothetical protein